MGVVYRFRYLLPPKLTRAIRDRLVERKLERHREQQRRELPPEIIAAETAPAAKAPIPIPTLPPAWPGFRGAARDGIVRSAVRSLPWPAGGPNVLWKQPIGGGQGSFAIAGGRAYTIEQRGSREVVASYLLRTGRELWTHRYEAYFQGPNGPPGPRSTPTVSGDRLYSLGSTGELRCLDAATGDLKWRRQILKDAESKNIAWGMTGSPLVQDGRVYVAPGGLGAAVIAYRADTGEPVWRSGNHSGGYAAPVIERVAGELQLLVFDGDGLSAYRPGDGSELWHFPWVTEWRVNASQPMVVDSESVFVSSGYGKGCGLLRVRREKKGYVVEPVWNNRNLKIQYSSAVFKDQYLYGPDDGILVCLDARSGERKWKGGRYGRAQVVLAGDYLVILCENGDLALVQANPEKYQELSRVPALDSDTMNHPAFGEGKMLIRNDREMMCLDMK
jgi:outer membrane protein assembly factor BamB